MPVTFLIQLLGGIHLNLIRELNYRFSQLRLRFSNTLGGEVLNLIKGKHSGDVNLLELKVSLKPGDSGGPILDEQGDLLGFIMADSKRDNSLSYAIASDKIQREYLKYQGSAVVSASAL